MKTLRLIAAAAALTAASMAPAMAQSTTFTNGSFDNATNNLSGWQSFGDVAVVGTRKMAALTTASVLFEDDYPLAAGSNNLSGNAAIDFFTPGVNSLAGVSFAALDTVGNGFGLEGSAIRQDFTATAGSTLTVRFDWAFLSADTSKADFAFIAINDQVVKFTDAFSAPAVSNFTGTFGDFSQVNWGFTTTDFTYTATQNGAVSLVVGVVDLDGADLTSELRVDNFTVTAVPEPESYAMLLAGLGVMGAIARRRRA